MREDLTVFYSSLKMYAHYEAGLIITWRPICVKPINFLIKMDDLHEVQKAMIRFVRT